MVHLTRSLLWDVFDVVNISIIALLGEDSPFSLIISSGSVLRIRIAGSERAIFRLFLDSCRCSLPGRTWSTFPGAVSK